MDIMCGADNSYTCDAEKWFTYMGSISNGYSPFNIFYIYTNESDGNMYEDPSTGIEYIANDPSIVPCDQPVPDTVSKEICSSLMFLSIDAGDDTS